MKDELEKEKNFFHDISPKIIKLVNNFQKSTLTLTHKSGSALNYATEGDIAVEKLLASEIRRLFPTDLIHGEELSSTQRIDKGRVWLIDPICGTSNFARGFNTFATEIALSQDNKLIAGCVVDHSGPNYMWSVGGNKVFVNKDKLVYKKHPGTKVEIDMGTIPNLTPSQREPLVKITERLMRETDYTISSYDSSLNSIYVASGKLDAYIMLIVDPLHFAAAIFLVQQSGGIVTDFSGSPWTLQSKNTDLSHDKKLHEELIGFLN